MYLYVSLKEHNIIDRQIRDTILLIDPALIGENKSPVDVVFTDAEESVQSTMHLIVFP